MKEKIAVIGCGIAGLETALRTERKGFEVDVIEPKESMIFYPTAHKLLEGYNAEKFSIDYRKKFKERNINHIQEKAEEVNFNTQEVFTENKQVKYDYLVIAAGSETKFHGVPGNERSETMRFKEEPEKIHRKLSNNEAESVVVVGGGATGVEATASLLELRKQKGFRISLIHSSERLLPYNSQKLASSVESSLKKKDVDLRLGERAEQINETNVKLSSGEEVEADLVLWAGGVKPNKLVEDLDLDSNQRGISVNEKMQTSEHNVFAVGDISDYEGKCNRALYSLFEAKTVAGNIYRKSNNKELSDLEIKWDPEIIYLGKRDSALEVSGFCIRGIIPSLLRSVGVEKRYLLTRRYLL